MSVYNKLIVKLGLPLSDSVGGVKFAWWILCAY